MNIVSIIVLVLVFIYGTITMKISARIIGDNKFSSFNEKIKREIIISLKKCWKRLIIILAIIVSMILIMITTFMGNGNRNEVIMSVIAVATGFITLISIEVIRRKTKKEIEAYVK